MKPIFSFVLQRTRWDCGVACLASYLCQPYEEVLRVASTTIKGIEHGLTAKEMIRVAKKFDVELRRRVRGIDLDESQGILGFRIGQGGHVVVLSNGLIFDPDESGMVWDAETYVRHYKKIKVDDLLEEV